MGRMKKKKTDGLSEIPKVPEKNISLNQLVGPEQRVGGNRKGLGVKKNCWCLKKW